MMKKTLIYLFVIFSVITCSVDNDELDYEMGTIEREEEVSKTGARGIDVEVQSKLINYKIYKNEDIYKLEDFEIAGMKKPKEFPNDSLGNDGKPYTPNAISNFTGWFKSSQYGIQDIELRFYATNSDAKEFGRPAADIAMQLTKKTVLGSVQVQAPIFGGYILSGNTIILCSKSIEVCDEIYEKIQK